LILNGFDYRGMAVSGVGHANAAGKIQVLVAVGGIDVTAFAALDN
jgi:hypothetical protein